MSARVTAKAGYRGRAIAGNWGRILIEYWCDESERHKIKIGYIGEDGLKPNTLYKLNDQHEFVQA